MQLKVNNQRKNYGTGKELTRVFFTRSQNEAFDRLERLLAIATI